MWPNLPSNITVRNDPGPCAASRPLSPASQCTKPSEKRNAKSDRGSELEADLDGLFQLFGHDNCDPSPRLYIQDSASGSFAGPFANGDIVQLTKKHSRQDSNDAKDGKNASPPNVAQIRLQGNGLLYGVDASGNIGASVLCTVP